MKKIITIIILIFFSLNIYTVNSSSEKLEKIYLKVDKICDNSEKNCKNLKLKIDKISYKYKNNKKIFFLLEKISDYLEIKLKKISEKLNNGYNVFVLKVIDGDTIVYKKNGKKFVARLIGIDAPENSITRYGYIEEFGEESRKFLDDLIFNKEVFIEYDSSQAKTDKYGRHLVYIFYLGENINKKIIEEGLAKEYTYSKDYKYKKEFLEAQEKAKKQKKGIWGLDEEKKENILNHIDNHDDEINENCNIKGNINSKGKKIYHLPNCKSYKVTKIDLQKGEKYFCTEKEAQEEGFVKAGNCGE